MRRNEETWNGLLPAYFDLVISVGSRRHYQIGGLASLVRNRTEDVFVRPVDPTEEATDKAGAFQSL